MNRSHSAAPSNSFADALRMEIAAAGEDHKALRRVAKVLIENAESGDIRAIRELANRLDGKAHQSTDIEHNEGSDLERLMVEISEANNLIVPLPE